MARHAGQEGTRFASPDGMYQTDDFVKFKRYMKQFHGKDVKRSDYETVEDEKGRSSAPAPWEQGQEAADREGVERAGATSVSGSGQEQTLEGHAEAVPGQTRPMPPRRPKKKVRGRGKRAANRRAAD